MSSLEVTKRNLVVGDGAQEDVVKIRLKVFGDEKMTLALLDRLGQRAHILTTKGRSYRTRKQLTQAPKRA